MKLADVCMHTGELVCIGELYAISNRLFIIIVSAVNCGDGNSKYPSIYGLGIIDVCFLFVNDENFMIVQLPLFVPFWKKQNENDNTVSL